MHDPFDARAVVPGAVEEDELAARRKWRHEALKIPLVRLAVGRLGRREDSRFPRAHMRDHIFDRAVLAGAVASFEDDQNARFGFYQIALQLDEFDLERAQLAVIGAFLCIGHDPLSKKRAGSSSPPVPIASEPPILPRPRSPSR